MNERIENDYINKAVLEVTSQRLQLPRFMIKNYSLNVIRHIQLKVEAFLRNFEIPIERQWNKFLDDVSTNN